MARTTEAATDAREKILNAADSLFGELGFDAASTRLIAERSTVNKALIHYHFRNKDELFGAVLDRYYERLGGLLAGPLTAHGDLRERLDRLVDGYVDFLAANRSFSRMVQREASGGPHLERIVAHMAPVLEQGTAVVQGAFTATRSGELEAAQLLVSFYGMVVSYFTYSPVLERLWGADPLSPRRLERRKQHLRRMLGLVLEGLEGDEREPNRTEDDDSRVGESR